MIIIWKWSVIKDQNYQKINQYQNYVIEFMPEKEPHIALKNPLTIRPPPPHVSFDLSVY